MISSHHSNGPDQGSLKQNSFLNFLSLPPLAGQHRIVAKLEAHMVLCERLGYAVSQADTTRGRLLEALLHEALEPASREMEAAE